MFLYVETPAFEQYRYPTWGNAEIASDWGETKHALEQNKLPYQLVSPEMWVLTGALPWSAPVGCSKRGLCQSHAVLRLFIASNENAYQPIERLAHD